MKQINKILAVVGAAVLLTLVACEHKGPAEKAGEKIDKAAEKAGDAIDHAKDKIKDAADDAKDKASDFMDKLKK
jgi:ElaB/YqjD/DUF883 family membrane-anchored ribosome-binding protein